MSPREFELDEALDKYEKEKEETKKAGGVEAEQKEFEISRKEKKLKKPGSVSRFFNQFGIGKYWERLNDYFEQEEQMEKEEAEREASKETAGDIKAAAEEKVSAVKEVGAKMPTKILESAARAGAREEEAAPVVAEVKAEAAQIEQEAKAAKTDLGEEIEILEQKPLEDEIREKYKNTPVRGVDVRIKSLESNIRSEKNLDMRELLEAERDILVEIKKEKEPAKVPDKKIEVKLPPWDEEEGLKDLPPVEEFEAAAKEHEDRAVPSPEKVKAVDVLEEEVEETAEEEMKKAEIKPVRLDKGKEKVSDELPPDSGFKLMGKVKVLRGDGQLEEEWIATSFDKDAGRVTVVKFDKKKGWSSAKHPKLEELKNWQKMEVPPSIEEIKPVEVLSEEIIGAEWKPKTSKGFEERQPEIFDAMEESFFAKGEKGSKARLERMLNSLEKVGEAYVAQKAAKEISAQDEKALKKWIAETKGAIDVLKKSPEMKPEKVIELKKKKPAKRRAA